MDNRLLIGIATISIVILLIGLSGLIWNNHEFDALIDTGGGLFVLTGTYLLIKNGQFINSKEYRISRIGISLLLLGVMFKIMHWRFSGQILAAGCLCFPIIYSVYLIRKATVINWTNWLKLLFLILFFTGRYFKLMHWGFDDEFSMVSIIVLVVLVFDFIVNSKLKK